MVERVGKDYCSILLPWVAIGGDVKYVLKHVTRQADSYNRCKVN